MNYKQLCCIVIDSGMNTWVVKQEKLQDLFSTLKREDIISQVGNEDIFELLWEIIYRFKCNNKYELEDIVNRLNDIIIDMEQE